MNSTDLAAFKELIATPSLPDIGPGPRSGTKPISEVNRAMDEFLARKNVPIPLEPLLRSAALLWHDHLDESHTLSQSIASSDGSFLHGIMHRREPDYSNAKYWFRQVGRHGCFMEITQDVKTLLRTQAPADLASKLIPRDQWEPFRFVDLCEEAALCRATDPQRRLLQEIQAIEFEALLRHWFAGA